MSTGPVNIPKGKIIGFKWRVLKQLGKGGCGAVYLVEDIDHPELRAALKAESNYVAGGAVLKMEVEMMQKLAGKEHTAQLLQSGKRDAYSYMVMSLLGESLATLLKRFNHNVSVSTQVRIGIHVLHGLKQIHDIGFIHRDIKPANLAIGFRGTPDERVINILDFGLSRQYIIEDRATGQMKMRRARTNILFRGTTRYCSMATHDRLEQGRCDDLWSLLYVLVECRSRLPWAHLWDKSEVAEKKKRTDDVELLKNCPVQMLEFCTHIRSLTYYNRPDYLHLYNLLVDVMIDGGFRFTDRWDWEPESRRGVVNTSRERIRPSREKLSLEAVTAIPMDELILPFPESDFSYDPFGV